MVKIERKFCPGMSSSDYYIVGRTDFSTNKFQYLKTSTSLSLFAINESAIAVAMVRHR